MQTPSNEPTTVAVDEIYAEIKAAFGMVPNFFRSQGEVDSQWLHLNWQRWSHIMGQTRALDRKTKELIAVAVSLVNNCEYCTLAHEHMALTAGTTEQEIAEMKQVVELFCSFNNIADSLKVPCDI